MNYHKLREFLSSIEHEQWMYWSKDLAKMLERIDLLIDDDADSGDIDRAREIIKNKLKDWAKNWKEYKKLPDHVKDYDREWADKILDQLPISCPVYQCGGLMKTKERKQPKNFIESEPCGGDDQTPDLVCTNCNAFYQFKGFKNVRKKN